MIAPALLEITWTDPVTSRQGFVVIDTLVRGLASGGLRLREGCTLDEVRDLARGMTRKEALVYDPTDNYLPFGGGKGGIDVDPHDPAAKDVLRRFLAAVRPIVREQWNTGEDFGVRQETLEEVAAEIGLPSTIEAVFATLEDPDAARHALQSAFAVTEGGIGLGDLVGGYGVAQAALIMAERLGKTPAQTRAVIQGFGSIGGAVARYLARAGVVVVAIADRDGLIRNEHGLDVETLLSARDGLGVIDRSVLREGDVTGPREDWLTVPCDVLVPAAMSYVIDVDDVPRINARIVVEGANGPTLPAAEAALRDRGIVVVPDFVANVMTNAWWWWVTFSDVQPTADSAFAKIRSVMQSLLHTITADADSRRASLREAALAVSERNSALLAERVGITSALVSTSSNTPPR